MLAGSEANQAMQTPKEERSDQMLPECIHTRLASATVVARMCLVLPTVAVCNVQFDLYKLIREANRSTVLILTSKKNIKEHGFVPKTEEGLDTIQDALTAAVSANPSRNWNAVVFAGPQGTDITKPITAVVTIEYSCLFNQIKTNTGS